jgi:hypothetical protein
MEAWRCQMELSRVADLHHFVEEQYPDPNKVKRWIRIRIKVNRWIQIHIKVKRGNRIHIISATLHLIPFY